ncbi:MAG: hypothetical protein IAE89_11000, partial [Anaerolineae bacterium]|nr:hypothetical protein [Anaerolineae bacterium]
LEERERVGMELHDGIIQSLYAIGMQMQLMKLSQPTMKDELSKATRSLDVVIEDIRHYILNLKVAHYEQQSLRVNLLDVLARLHIPDTLTVEINAPDRQPPFGPPVVEAVCQIAYEAISNVIRHAEATNAAIEVTEDAHAFRMVIRDDGRGFNPTGGGERHGLGLHNVIQRARIYGGDVEVESMPGSGTRLILTLPT